MLCWRSWPLCSFPWQLWPCRGLALLGPGPYLLQFSAGGQLGLLPNFSHDSTAHLSKVRSHVTLQKPASLKIPWPSPNYEITFTHSGDGRMSPDLCLYTNLIYTTTMFLWRETWTSKRAMDKFQNILQPIFHVLHLESFTLFATWHLLWSLSDSYSVTKPSSPSSQGTMPASTLLTPSTPGPFLTAWEFLGDPILLLQIHSDVTLEGTSNKMENNPESNRTLRTIGTSEKWTNYRSEKAQWCLCPDRLRPTHLSRASLLATRFKSSGQSLLLPESQHSLALNVRPSKG